MKEQEMTGTFISPVPTGEVKAFLTGKVEIRPV